MTDCTQYFKPLKAGFLLLVLLTIFSCNKDQNDEAPMETDYRDQYCGEWNFTTNYSSFNMLDSSSSSTVYHYNGMIDYSQDGNIDIEYRENISISLCIDAQGNLFKNADYPITGQFMGSDSVSFGIRTGGNGGGTYQVVVGVRN